MDENSPVKEIIKYLYGKQNKKEQAELVASDKNMQEVEKRIASHDTQKLVSVTRDLIKTIGSKRYDTQKDFDELFASYRLLYFIVAELEKRPEKELTACDNINK